MKITLKYLIIPIITLVLGVVIGVFIRDFPQFSMDYNIKITDVLSIIVTLSIGLFIPFIIKKMIDDRNTLKNNLIEEVGSFVKIASKIDERITTIYNTNKITQRNKDDINLLFELADDEFNSLFEFLKENCDKESNKLLDKVKDKYFEYWKILTGTEIMKSNVKKITDSSLKSSSSVFNEIKTLTRKIKSQLINM